MRHPKVSSDYVLCISNRGYKTSLIIRRIYRLLADREAESRGLLRVVDESGEDYLFPETLFETIDLPKTVEKKLALVTH